MPAEPDARREVLLRVRQRLHVVAKAEIERQIVADAHVVLRECADEPLVEGVGRDPIADRLRVVLNVRERQRVERRGRGVEECERAEHGKARLVAHAAGCVARGAAADTNRLPAARPGQRVGELL